MRAVGQQVSEAIAGLRGDVRHCDAVSVRLECASHRLRYRDYAIGYAIGHRATL